MTDTAAMTTWIKDIRAHALKNYNKGGWDYIVEAYEDADIAEEIGDAKTYKEALRNVKKILHARNDRRKDIQAEGGAW